MLLLAVPVSALLAFVVGFSISVFATRLFVRGYLESKLSLARAIARSIDGDEHRRFDSYASTADPVYRKYLAYLSGIMAEERSITYLYTLNYDRSSQRLTYVLDAQIAPRDLLWVETGTFAFVVSFDEEGRALFEVNQEVHVDAATVEVEGRSLPLRVTAGSAGRELMLGQQRLATIVSLDPLEVRTPAGVLNRTQRTLQAEVGILGRPTVVHYSFSGRGDSQSDPGSLFVDSEETVAHVRQIIRSGSDTVEPELRRDIYGESLSAYGIIRDRGGEPSGAVMIDMYAVEIGRFRRSLGFVVYPASLLAFAVALAGLLALSQMLVVPLRRLITAVDAVTEGRLDVRIPMRRGDEIGVLARRFNTMVESLASNIADLRRTEERLAGMAYKDELTGLLNRKSFYDRLNETLTQARRSEHEKLRGLLFLDLDHFKDVNDSLGHDIGDLLLRQVADRLRASVRESDYVFRQGGDEFTVVLSVLTRETDAAIVAQKLIDSLEEPFEVQGNRLHIGTSIGIAIHPRDGLTVEQLVKSADTALFDAKKERHVFRYFTPEMQEQALAKIGLMSRLLHSLEAGTLSLHYQPQLDAVGRVVGIEALLRWTDGERGAVGPDEFVPLAEETGAILPIGKWVLGQACLQARDLKTRGLDAAPVFVNLTAREFLARDLLQTVEEAILATGIPRSAIGLEVCESVFRLETQVVERLKTLRRWGTPVIIDRFGTGSSSLVGLRGFPVRAVKIDRRLVSDVERSRSDVEIIKAIVAFSYAAGQQVIAVGVEREEQARLLRSVGCEVLQGFHLCRPLEPAALVAYLGKR